MRWRIILVCPFAHRAGASGRPVTAVSRVARPVVGSQPAGLQVPRPDFPNFTILSSFNVLINSDGESERARQGGNADKSGLIRWRDCENCAERAEIDDERERLRPNRVPQLPLPRITSGALGGGGPVF